MCIMDQSIAQIRKSTIPDLFAAADAHQVRVFKRAIRFWNARDTSLPTVCVLKHEAIALRHGIDPRVEERSRERRFSYVGRFRG